MQVKRTKVYKVRFSEEEVTRLKDEAQVLQIAKFLRETAFQELDRRSAARKAKEEGKAFKQKKKAEVYYSKLDRDFLLELSRIGNNINQIARGINQDLAKGGEPLDAAKLLHLLIAVNENLEALRDDLK